MHLTTLKFTTVSVAGCEFSMTCPFKQAICRSCTFILCDGDLSQLQSSGIYITVRAVGCAYWAINYLLRSWMYRTWSLLATVCIQPVDVVARRGEIMRASARCRHSWHDKATATIEHSDGDT